jgi:hypothetical protein
MLFCLVFIRSHGITPPKKFFDKFSVKMKNQVLARVS